MSILQTLPMILCGGSGTRLWPVSREQYPKQFTAIHGPHSLLQETVLRYESRGFEAPLLLCHEANRFLVQAQLQALNLPYAELLLEPVSRNTAPAVCAAIVWTLAEKGDQILVISPSDHVITDQQAFEQSLEKAIALAQKDQLVTLGICPDTPETGYGYILAGENHQVKAFCEKPDLETAKAYLASGNYLWNSGLLIVKASILLQELRRYQPQIVALAEAAYQDGAKDLNFFRFQTSAFEAMPSISLDYAILEKTCRAAVVPLNAHWSDVGSWKAIHELKAKDQAANVLQGDVLAQDTQNTLVYGGDRLITTLGVRDLVVIDTEDALLVAHRDACQDVKGLAETLRVKQRPEAEFHRRVYRPWGYYESLKQGPGFQVKRLVVKPGESLSLQRHHHRSEHWVVIQGQAQVTLGERMFNLEENESTFIPLGTKHRLENPGQQELAVIEVQTGDYLGEDDIERFEDKYARSVQDESTGR